MEENIVIREAVEADIPAIIKIFEEIYSDKYPYDWFYDEDWLKRSIYNDSILLLAADVAGEVLGTASVVFEVGARNDMVAEFGRLGVSPRARGLGLGNRLMDRRVELVQERIHVGLVENRTVHSYSQKISGKFGFAPVGFLPQKHKFLERESLALFCKHFGKAGTLRKNHPRIIPEAQAIAHLALKACGLPNDVIVDESMHVYHHDDEFELEPMTSDTLADLLRIERGRVHSREVFGPLRLHYGFFLLSTARAEYLIAKRKNSQSPAGALGYIHSREERSLKVMEVVAAHEGAIRFLFEQLIHLCRTELAVDYLEADVSAYSPRIQRTLLELGFLPTAFIPAMVFHDVERLDVVRMSMLLVEWNRTPVNLTDEAMRIFEEVRKNFEHRSVLPLIADHIPRIALFHGLNADQQLRLGGLFAHQTFSPGETLYKEGEPSDRVYVVLGGELEIHIDGRTVGTVGTGGVVGEISALTGADHGATVKAKGDVEVGSLPVSDLNALVRRRPDIGLVVYRNLAGSLGKKLLKKK